MKKILEKIIINKITTHIIITNIFCIFINMIMYFTPWYEKIKLVYPDTFFVILFVSIIVYVVIPKIMEINNKNQEKIDKKSLKFWLKNK